MDPNPDLPISFSFRMLRRTLHSYWRFARGLTVGVRAAVLTPENEVFLVRHTYFPGWYLPGGGVEPGESSLQALVRELAEEARVALCGPPALHGIFFNARVSRRDHVLVYVVREFRIIESKRPDREIAEAGFFPADRLPDDTSPATRRRVQEIIAGAPAPETW
jgi:8-oxo-dGTP pyrophosphatase MutT (NUDIX family)